MILEKTISEIGSCNFSTLVTTFTAKCRKGDLEIKGCGRLYIDDDGRLKFNYAGVASGKVSRLHKIGHLVDEDDLFVLEMVDQSGITWTSCGVFLHVGGMPGIQFSDVVDLSAIETNSRSSISVGSFGDMWFGYRTGLPRNASSETDTAIRVSRKRRHTNGGASSFDRTILRNIESQPSFLWKDKTGVCNYRIKGENTANELLQALFFVTGEYLRAYLTVERRGFWEATKIFSTSRNVKVTQSQPVRYKEYGDENRDQIYSLFKKYIGYISADGDRVGNWNKITEDWYKVANVRGVSVQLEILSLCTTIEGVIHKWHGMTLVKGVKGADIEKIIAGIEVMKIGKPLKERVRKIIMGSLLNKRCIDIMHKLSSADGITKGMINTWKSCRNPSAHGYMTSDINDAVLAQRDVLYSLLSLLYLKRLRYRGERTRYDIDGWPLKKVV
jgi:hypothetical protein